MASFCPNCGKPVDENAGFCGGCGTKLGGGPPAVAASPAPVPVATPMATAAATTSAAVGGPAGTSKRSGGGCGKVLVVVGMVFALLVVLGIGGFAYIAYRAKKKVDEVKQAYKEGNLDKIAGALGGKENTEAKDADAMPNYPEYTPGSTPKVMAEAGGASEAGAKGGAESSMGSIVPMKAGLRITTAIQQSVGDYESMKAIKSVNAEAVLMNYSADVPEVENPFDDQAKKRAEKPKLQSVRGARKILREDLQNAHEYAEHFGDGLPLTIPNTTALGISANVLNELKTKGQSLFTYQAVGLKGALGGLLGGLGGMAGGSDNLPVGQNKEAQEAMKSLNKLSKVSCILKRTDHKTYSFPVLVNGVRMQLPALRATCKSEEDEDAEFYFLDDPQNPLSLTWKIGSNDRLQVIKLEYVAESPASPTSGPSKELEQKLENKEKVEIYGIYFDFASAKIKPESKPTLDEIAGVMKAHPDWKLNVDGHTDNVGTDPGNLELSEQRAAAVKAELVASYHIAAERLDTSGHGASQPVETNATMEGRARNRRVELSRE
jgi:outer membrane protein OmpA-like peptidoglycan-associated protein